MTAVSAVDLMSEDALLRCVVDLARTLGYRVHHQRPAWTSHGMRSAIQGDAGFVDLVMARQGLVIFAELKSEAGRLSKEQRAWLDALPDYYYYVWRPRDWQDGSIARILR